MEVTNAVTWGHTRGCLEEQRITPIEGGGLVDMTVKKGSREMMECLSWGLDCCALHLLYQGGS